MNTPPDKLKPEEMPAFPLHNGDVWGGMTMRDYFAGKALSGYLSDPNVTIQTDATFGDIARVCYKFADAMLKARSG